MNCRHCNSPLEHTFLDLGFAPPSNAYLSETDLVHPEIYYPLKLKVCTNCWLVQTEDYTQADELFSADYAYFSSTSSSWLEHAKKYSEGIIERLGLNTGSFVIEVASNDGYLLKNFVAAGISCLGIEPTDSTADAAEILGIPVLREFFGEKLAQRLKSEGKQADLIAGNNVYAHVPDINDFTLGLKAALKSGGTITLEFPHLMRLIQQVQFDTVYHEHFSYLSLYTVSQIFRQAGLRIYNVEKLSTHGGSLRIYGCHINDKRQTAQEVNTLLDQEKEMGLQSIAIYQKFQEKADKVKNELLKFLIEKKMEGKRVIGYGAAAKGNTLLNYAGVKPDLLPVVYDAAKSKQDKYLPGSHIPILSPGYLTKGDFDYIFILPWNIKEEVIKQLDFVSVRNCYFVTAIPEMRIES